MIPLMINVSTRAYVDSVKNILSLSLSLSSLSLSPHPPLQLLWVFEHLAAITTQPAETPNERNFQAQYGETINSALQRLRSPLNYATPHTVWEPFKEVS